MKRGKCTCACLHILPHKSTAGCISMWASIHMRHPPVSAGSKSHVGIFFLCLSMSPVLRRFKLRTKKHLRMFAASFHLLYMIREGLNTPYMGEKKCFSNINYTANYVILRGLVYILCVYLLISKYGCSFAAGVDS